MNLSKLQERIINAPENRIGVEASAAAGKTTVLTEKVRKLIRDGYPAEKIAVVTFTRMAAGNLIDRLGADYNDKMFIGTIHSLAANQLGKHGMGGKIKSIAEDEEFDKLFNLCQGLDLRNVYTYMLVDECQDCGVNELNFIFEMINPTNFFCVYDRKQTIYGFRGARPQVFMSYLTSRGASIYDLNENFRNGRIILEYAKRIISRAYMEDKSIAIRSGGRVIEEKTTANALPLLLRYIENMGELKDWAVICRDNASVRKIENLFKQYNVPYNTFKQGDLTKKQLEQMMNEDKVQVLTIHSAKGLEWNNVAVLGTRWWNEEEVRVNYVAATRAKDFLLWFK